MAASQARTDHTYNCNYNSMTSTSLMCQDLRFLLFFFLLFSFKKEIQSQICNYMDNRMMKKREKYSGTT